MSHECEKCGDEFDSQRGLSIHKSQMHSEEEKQESSVEDTDTAENDNKAREDVNESSQQGITLTAKQFGGLTFATGLFLGLALGVMLGGFSGVQTETVGAPAVDNSGDNQGSHSGSSIVELSSAEYPYGDLEAGVGSGERTYGNITFNLDGEPYIGSPDADVTAVSYEDFECPFCKRYNEGAYSQIVENFVRNGEVQYFYKNLPLQQIHPWSEPAALASECALNQDAEVFWTFKQGFFSNQEQLGNAYENSNFDKSMYRWAEQTGLDTEQFRTCYDNDEEIEEVQQDKQEAGENGAQATPTVLINDQKLEGAQPYSRFESTIQSALQ